MELLYRKIKGKKKNNSKLECIFKVFVYIYILETNICKGENIVLISILNFEYKCSQVFMFFSLSIILYRLSSTNQIKYYYLLYDPYMYVSCHLVF